MKLESARSVCLSARELQVAAALAEWGNTKQVSVHLVISTWTVKTHLSRIRKKLGVATNVEAIHFLTKTGLI
jgi:DNA-binding CsgD family transcriptional regulator